ncbi:hypothetical protein D0867_00278 [Hortaea werneckii]|uniref:Rhodopsin domain-containing protein n=2 Tax=Hortaea werneckii TaxID=91943 RepID=A0A3M7AF82_HORWE|nr:hypothetical protein D0867_00278 [Hortaea werneckii]
MGQNTLPPLFSNTATDRGAPPVVIGYIGASITVLSALIRLFLTIKKKHGFSADDYCWYTAAVFGFIASITLERAVDVGLGRHDDVLATWQLNAYTKLTYTTSLLGIIAQSAAKLSVAFLYERIAPRQDKRGIAILLSCIGVWILFAFFGTAFACNTTLKYSAHCSTGGYLRFPIIVTNFVTDAMLAFWMLPRIYHLQANWNHRIVPMVLMSTRFLVCCVQLGQIGYWADVRESSEYDEADRTWTAVTGYSLGIAVIHLSIITATVPRINTFLADMQTKQAGLALTQRDYDHWKSSNSNSANNSRNWNSNKRSSKGPLSSLTSPRKSTFQDPTASFTGSRHNDNGMLSSFRPDRQAQLRNDCSRAPQDGNGDEIEMDVRDNVETSSQSSLQRNAVYQKTEFRWEEEYTGSSPTPGDVGGRRRL